MENCSITTKSHNYWTRVFGAVLAPHGSLSQAPAATATAARAQQRRPMTSAIWWYFMYFNVFYVFLYQTFAESLMQMCAKKNKLGFLALFAPNPWWHPGSFCNRICTFSYIFVQAPCGITESHQEFQEDWCWNQRRATEKIRQSVSATAEALGPVAPIKDVPPQDFAMTRCRQQR